MGKPLMTYLMIALLTPGVRAGELKVSDDARARVSFVGNGQKLNDYVGRGVALADFDGDGALDAFVVNEVGSKSQFRLYAGDGRGMFSESGQPWESSMEMAKPVAYDINGDGTKDVVVGRTVWVNDGHGRFTADRTRFLDSDEAMLWQCRLADLNGDGLIDVFAIAMANGETRGRVYLNDNKGCFRYTGQPLGHNMQAAVGLGDVNGDGFPDAVMSGWRNAEADSCPNRVFFNDGRGRFTDSGQIFDEGMRHSHGLALGDLDKDGDLDIVLVTQHAPFARLLLNDGSGRFAPGGTLGTGQVEKVAVVDLNGDGCLDILLACIGPNEVWLNNGQGGFSDSGLRLGTEWSWDVAVGDTDKDGLPDLFAVDLGLDNAAPPEKRMQSRFAEVWINTSNSRRP
jgi:hypothetical protein